MRLSLQIATHLPSFVGHRKSKGCQLSVSLVSWASNPIGFPGRELLFFLLVTTVLRNSTIALISKMRRSIQRKKTKGFWAFKSHYPVNLKSCQGCLSCAWQFLSAGEDPDGEGPWPGSSRQELLPLGSTLWLILLSVTASRESNCF